MFWIKKLTLLVTLFMVGMLLLAACGAEEPTPVVVEEVVDTQATAEAEAAIAADARADTEEPDVASESSSETQAPTQKSEVPRISAEELKERLDNGETIVIGDTRSIFAYNDSHIAGAISVPVSEAVTQLEGIPLDQAIILYCS